MASRLSKIHWGRILAALLLIYLLSLLTVFCVIFAYAFGLGFQARGAPDPEQIQLFANRVAPWIGQVGLVILTLLASFLLARRARSSPQAHGILLGALVALLSLLIDRSPHLANLLALSLTIGAGWLGGFLGGKGGDQGSIGPPSSNGTTTKPDGVNPSG